MSKQLTPLNENHYRLLTYHETPSDTPNLDLVKRTLHNDVVKSRMIEAVSAFFHLPAEDREELEDRPLFALDDTTPAAYGDSVTCRFTIYLNFLYKLDANTEAL